MNAKTFAVWALAGLLAGCAFGRTDSGREAAKGGNRAKVIFDTDMFSDYDDVGALAVLHKLADAGKCEILATVSSTRGNQSVAMCEVLNAYFGRPEIPVGAPTAPAVEKPSSANYRAVVRKYAKWVRHENANDAEDAVKVYRRLLSAADDRSVTACIVGFMTNFRRLLESDADDISPMSGRDLVAQKIRRVVIMGFMFPRGREYNIYCDPSSARYVLENCPAPMVFSGWEFGCDIFSGRKVSELKTESDPVKDMFAASLLSREDAAKARRPDHDWEGMGHNSYDQTGVLAAVLGDCAYFALERGTVTMVGDKGDNVWRAHPDGPHARLVPRMPKRALGALVDDTMAEGALLAKHGVLCLTFDDSCFGDWEKALPLFAKYEAHATFFTMGAITPERLASMRRLRAAGHSVGLHTLKHTNAPVPFAGRRARDWFAAEVQPQLDALAAADFPVTAFAYPNNANDAESDLTLDRLGGFTKFRTGAMDCNYRGDGPATDFASLDMGFVPVNDRRKVRSLWAFGLGPTRAPKSLYKTTRENVFRALGRAAERNEIVTFFSHSLKPGNTDWIGLETEFLVEILSEAKRLGLRVVGFEELDR